ncbi:hypothetical protein [Rummeliibacillus stabekisii]|uniref:hypothetical protein n=1 Tax=Rummeliibacillus stabekisii TaxID=241244 RepID=UPI003713E096
MFFKKNKVEVVPESEWTDFGSQHATRKDLAIAACVPTVASLGMVAWNSLTKVSTPVEVAAVSGPAMPQGTPDTYTAIPTGAVTDHIAGTSLDVLTTIMDPIIDILVALALPLASLMIIGACFFIILGQKEKAYSIMFNSAIGYVLIQMSPMLLNILKTAGTAVQPQ